ncbi:MAG TPA: hypothetical protein VGN91_25095 [Bosea sp. (in: a-proteobacteria)]|nr:hypothetical protein [Bosea sp. (in: a-proteobacteria)]
MRGAKDCLYNAVEVLGDFTIPEAQDAIAMCGQVSRACDIMNLRSRQPVLIAIELDHEFGVEMCKVRKIRAHGSLSAEMAARYLEQAQLSP